MLRPSGELLVRFNQTVAIVPWARQVLKDSYVRSNISNVVFGDFFPFLRSALDPCVSWPNISKKLPWQRGRPKEGPSQREPPIHWASTKGLRKERPPQRGLPCFKASQKGPPQVETPHKGDYHASKHPQKDHPKDRPPTKGTTMLQSIPERTTSKKDPHKGDYPTTSHPKKSHSKERPPTKWAPLPQNIPKRTTIK